MTVESGIDIVTVPVPPKAPAGTRRTNRPQRILPPTAPSITDDRDNFRSAGTGSTFTVPAALAPLLSAGGRV